MKNLLLYLGAIFGLLSSCTSEAPIKNEMRAPAYPLITIDPYTSAWSMTDNLYDDQVRHWTGLKFPLMGVLRVDGKPYRFMGTEEIPFEIIAPIQSENLFNVMETKIGCVEVIPTFPLEKSWVGAYTFTAPLGNWTELSYDDSNWSRGEAAFGNSDYTSVRTEWLGKDIWVRRMIEYNPTDLKGYSVFVNYSHDDQFELYLNGKKIVKTGYEWKQNQLIKIDSQTVKEANGKIVLAAHCSNKTGGALVDMGLYKQKNDERQMNHTARQQGVDVQPTCTIYDFVCGPVNLKLTFTAPLLMNDLDLLSRPVNYVSYEVVANDGKEHEVEIYFEAGPDWARNREQQSCNSEFVSNDQFNIVRTGTLSQEILAKKGDDLRIDWGYFYMAANKKSTTCQVGNPVVMRSDFVEEGSLSNSVEGNYMAITSTLKKVGSKPVENYIMLGYDDIYSIQYFNQNIRPYWNRDGNSSIEEQFNLAAKDYESLKKQCRRFDVELMQEAKMAGGEKYAELCALAYRQALSAHKLIETPNGELALLSKENFSNGSIGTVDVTYPSSPLFLCYNTDLAKALLNFIFDYSESGKWKKDFPAHDIGTYPIANGQTYVYDMPLEEGGNMLILTGAISAIEGKADYALKHWKVLSTWADYLMKNGQDPANQLCTDDFAGHLARNTNLSIKAILGVAAYGNMAEMLGKKELAETYVTKAKEMASIWKKMAKSSDHYRLTFDEGDTWSLKYNLVWDKLLGYNIFDADIAETEIAYYFTKQNKYGIPMDNRSRYTKSDWIIWIATMAHNKETFEKFIAPIYEFYENSSNRVPMSDWYYTHSKRIVGFRARSVVGGYFIKILDNRLNN